MKNKKALNKNEIKIGDLILFGNITWKVTTEPKPYFAGTEDEVWWLGAVRYIKSKKAFSKSETGLTVGRVTAA